MGSRIVPDGFSSHVIVASQSAVNQGADEEDDEDDEEGSDEGEATAASSAAEATSGEVSGTGSAALASTGGDKAQPQQEQQQVQKTPELTPEEMDNLMEKCFVEAIKNVIKDEQLPMDSSVVYNQMLAIRPEHIFLDMKKSSYKKLSKFITEMTKKKLIKTKDVNNIQTVVSINRAHPIYQSHVYDEARAAPAVLAAEEAKKDAAHAVLKITPLNKPTANVQQLFPDYTKDMLYTDDEVRAALVDYCAKLDLFTNKDQRNHAKLDQFLMSTLYKANENMKLGQSISITQLLKRLIDKMSPFYGLELNNEQLVKKGRIDVIKLLAETVRGNKAVTKAFGLEQFGIEFWTDDFQKELRTKMSASVTVRGENEPKSEPDVQVQGNLRSEMSLFLHTMCGVPKKYIATEDKTKKSKKK